MQGEENMHVQKIQTKNKVPSCLSQLINKNTLVLLLGVLTNKTVDDLDTYVHSTTHWNTSYLLLDFNAAIFVSQYVDSL